MRMEVSKPWNVCFALQNSRRIESYNTNKDAFHTHFSPYLTNKFFSFRPETIFQANLMNEMHTMPKDHQLSYWVHGLDKVDYKTAYFKEPDRHAIIKVLMDVYGFNKSKAFKASRCISNKEIKELTKKAQKGGKAK